MIDFGKSLMEETLTFDNLEFPVWEFLFRLVGWGIRVSKSRFEIVDLGSGTDNMSLSLDFG